MDDNFVGLFFVINGRVLLHSLSIAQAEAYGEFLIYPYSHMEIWDRHYIRKYNVDFDYYPRGRIVYHRNKREFWVYRDSCIPDSICLGLGLKKSPVLKEDEHYVCHVCNENYYE